MPDSSHTRQDRRIAYRVIAFAAELLLGREQPAILEAQYGCAEDRREVEEMAARVAARRFEERGCDAVRLDLTAERALTDAGRFPPLPNRWSSGWGPSSGIWRRVCRFERASGPGRNERYAGICRRRGIKNALTKSSAVVVAVALSLPETGTMTRTSAVSVRLYRIASATR